MARRGGELLWPEAGERRLLARFYGAVGVAQALYLIFPFEFAYLYLAMRRPQWSVLPLMAASATALLGQLPTGALADRWSRKASVLLGGALTAASFASVPAAVRLHGTAQLAGACAAFAVAGLGETLMAGAQEAWVVDNLHAAGRRDLVDTFFARSYAVTAVGGVIGGTAAVTILLLFRVDQALLDLLWYVTAAGFLAATALAAGIAEHREVQITAGPGEGRVIGAAPGGGIGRIVDGGADRAQLGGGGEAGGGLAGSAGDGAGGGARRPDRVAAPWAGGDVPSAAGVIPVLNRMGRALRIVVGRRVLLLLTLAVIVATVSSAASNEAFPVSLLTKGLDARLLAPLGIAEDLVGIAAPLLGLALARRLGTEPLLAVTLMLSGVLVTALVVNHGIVLVACLYVVLGFLDRMWDPVALARLQHEIPSAHRAAVSSLVYQAGGVAELAGLGLFGVLLGSDGGRLRDATPDLVQAFSGHGHIAAAVPTGWLGLALPDVAIVVFVLVGMAAVPFIVLAGRTGARGREAKRGSDGEGGGDKGTNASCA